MEKEFSKYLSDNKETLKEIVRLLSKKYSYVSLLACDTEGKKIAISNKEIKVNDSWQQERGFVVRVYNGKYYSEFSFNTIPSTKEAVKKIVASVNMDDLLEKSIYVKHATYDKIEEEACVQNFSRMDKYEDVSLEDIIKKAKKIIHSSMEEYEYIISATFGVEYLKISKMFLSTKKELTQVYAWANASYSCVVNRDDVTKFNYGGESSISLKEAINKIEGDIQSINEDATALLDAFKAQPGEYDCITTPEVSGLIAHEAFGHGVEMDMFVKNRALASQYMNQQVGSKLVNMHEGAIPYEDVSSYFFDDEGTLAQDTLEIKDGVLLSGIADVLAASKLHCKPTGNGKRESFKNKAYTRMTATYFESKDDNLEDMIASIQDGYLLDKEVSGMEDPKNWGIQCICLIGREIKNGKLTGRIASPMIMTGNVLDLLKSISMVSHDFALYGNGLCGKGYKEFVKTSVGGPYLKARVKLG